MRCSTSCSPGCPRNRDRALVAFWVSTGARASELLGVTCSGADPGQQLITVIRKGSRAMQQLPASPDAFVWLRLYQAQVHGLVPSGPDDPLWWTLRRPFRPLGYHAARAMFDPGERRAGRRVDAARLRHTAAYRMARDPGRCRSPTCNGYWATPPVDHAAVRDADGRGRHRERAGPSPPAGQAGAGRPQPAPGYRPRAWTSCSGGAAGDRRHGAAGHGRPWQLSAEAAGAAGEVPAAPGPGEWPRPADRPAAVAAGCSRRRSPAADAQAPVQRASWPC